jgi:hypothetical protein
MATNIAGLYTKPPSFTTNPIAFRTPPTALAQSACCCPACTGLECLDRTRFFAGQLLTESDLNNEQSYWLAKNRLHNRYLHGWGVVCGLQVVCAECDGWVTVKTGYAIDPCGNDIIVCEDQPFNVIQAIQACCAPPKSANCSPLRYTPSPTCQDHIQTWCVTIEYQEQPSRMVTPLRQVTPKGEACRCADPCQTTPGTTAQPCGCNTPQLQTPTPATNGSCEPTRIVEGFKICVVPGPTKSDTEENQPEPGTIVYQFELCLASLLPVLIAAPDLTKPNLSDAQAYQLVCNYLVMVKNALAKTNLTRCQTDSILAGIQVPPPDNSPNYIDSLGPIVFKLEQLVVAATVDCACTAIVPTCPPDVCDDRLILACVTVQNGKIINICHFGGRRQVITFPVLYYWLSLFGLDKIINLITLWLERLCCGPEESRYGMFGPAMFNREMVTTAGVTNPATVNRMMAQTLSQKMGATFVNAVSPTSQAVDLRPFIGQNLETMHASLTERYKMQNVTIKDVSNDPSWTDQTVAAAGQFAPAAFSLTQPLTVYVAGPDKQVVGFDVTDPLHALQQQVTEAHARLDSLARRVAAGPSAGAGPSKRRKRKGSP